jgi:hypothetical protein
MQGARCARVWKGFRMILVGQTFQAKYGRGDELVALFKELHTRAEFPHRDAARILTDASGRFFTVITEYETESLGAWEATFAQLMAHPEMGAWFGRMMDVTESGSRDFYNIVA